MYLREMIIYSSASFSVLGIADKDSSSDVVSETVVISLLVSWTSAENRQPKITIYMVKA